MIGNVEIFVETKRKKIIFFFYSYIFENLIFGNTFFFDLILTFINQNDQKECSYHHQRCSGVTFMSKIFVLGVFLISQKMHVYDCCYFQKPLELMIAYCMIKYQITHT